MENQPRLSDAEWALVIEMLERERDELPVEIRHTRSSTMRNDLHRRAEIVQELLHRLEQTPVG
jgi:hypothetical protein